MFRICFVFAFVIVLTGTMSAQQALSPTTQTPDEKSGRILFQTRCAMCHVGQQPATEMRGDNAPRRPATLGPLLSQANTADEERLRQTIEVGGVLMPGYRYALTEEQITQVIAFMKTIENPLTRLALDRPGEGALVSQGAEEGLLTGTVTSSSGAALEGVAVSAQIPGVPITTSVYTGADGRYFFPPIASGEYKVWAQAVGLERADRRAARAAIPRARGGMGAGPS